MDIKKKIDFICNDGKRYEVKFLYGSKLLFTKRQSEVLKKDDIILVFKKDGFHTKFLWGEREKAIFGIHIYDSSKYGFAIKISKEVKKMLNEIKIHHRETYEDIVKRLILDHKEFEK